MNKLLSLTTAAMLFAFPAMGQTVLALNGAGPINQLNALTLQASETNTAGFIVYRNDIAALSVGNSAGVSQKNRIAFLTLNAQGGINQLNVASVQASRANTAGVLVLRNDISATAVGNAASVDQVNNLALGVVNLQAGINQANILTAQVAQANTVGAVVARNDIGATAAGNAASIDQTN